MDVKSLFESLKKLIDVKINTYSKSITESLSLIEQRLNLNEESLKNISLQKGDKGDKGDKGEDGKSLTVDDVKPLIESLVKEIPVIHGKDGLDGKNGIDGKSVDQNVVNEFLEKLFEEHATLSLSLVRDFVKTAVQELPTPKDGTDGKSVTIEEVLPYIQDYVNKAVSELPKAKDGIDGKDGKDGTNGINGKDAFVDYTAISQVIKEEVKQIKIPEAKEIDIEEIVKTVIEKIPFPKDGKDGNNGKDGKDGVDGLNGKDGSNGKDGKDGEDGKDALELHIIENIDMSKSYPRSTYATIKGGLFKAFRSTDPFGDSCSDFERKGWTCIVKGIDSISIDFNEDENKLYLNIENSLGDYAQKEVRLPLMKYMNVWNKDLTYAKDHVVTSNGSMWISNVDNNTDRPGLSEAWTMCVKKGRDGKDGAKGRDGLNGKDGKDGQDLTHVSEYGAKY